MTPLRLILVVLAWAVLHAGGAFAQAPATSATAAPTAASLKGRLEALPSRRLPEAEQAAAKQALEQALGQLTVAEEAERELQELRKLLDAAPAEIAQSRRELKRLEASPERADAVDPAVGLAALQQEFDGRIARREELQRALGEANSLIIGAQTRPDRAQSEIQAKQSRAIEVGDALRSDRESGRPLTPERRDLLAAELLALEASVALKRQQLAGGEQLRQLGQARRDLLLQRIARQEREIQTLREAISALRREKSEQTVAEVSDEVRRGAAAGQDGILARETEINRRLSEFLLRSTDRLNDITQRNLQARQQLDALLQAEKTLEEQISVLQGSLLLTRVLYEQQQALPTLRLDPQLADRIADLRLYQFEINRQREQLADPAAYVERLLAQAPAESLTEAQRRDLQALLETRAMLLDRLNQELGALVNESFGLQLNQRQLKDIADRMRSTLNEQMFWVPSNRPVDLEWLAALPARTERQIASIRWGAITSDLLAGLQVRPLLSILSLALVGAVVAGRRAIRRRLAVIHLEVAEARGSGQWQTPKAVLLELVLSLPVALLLSIGGAALIADGRGFNPDFGAALLQMALAWLVFDTTGRVLAPGGIAELHFQWSLPSLSVMHRRLRWLGWVVMVLAAVATFAERQPAALAEDAVGFLVVLACLAAMTWLLGSLIVGEQIGQRSIWRAMANLVLGLMPLALIVIACLGYYYTALKLTGRLIETLYLLIGWGLLHRMTERALTVAARNLAAKRESRRRVAAAAKGEDSAEATVDEAPVRDIAQVNQQSMRLMRMALLGVLGFGLYLVWADLVTVFSYLENVTLYEYGSGTGDKMVMVPINLRDLLLAVAIVAGTVALARNLPGLLEVLVLSRLPLAQGSAYAITTLVSYVIAGVGVVATLSTLGLSWDKLQWLVAALSVGLGFGLQEIFANFISGLIILFERPARIGDVVTIGNLSGTVSRIQIRATTITDFDRKEIIVPNKTFVTDQLVNWTLTDTITRVTITLGVAYGSDLELVRRLLLQIARANPRVLAEPAPLVVFQSFGASTLDHELRVHVRELVDRVAVVDEINRRIDQVFREHGIEIAFGQVDVHIRSFAGPEALLQRLPGAAPEGGKPQ
ncbi:MAG TPA: mechanosensitive channel MscK [Quisquiliibacterium sp.]|nr:mechanosensitive channel MscK [Quisquiliibacterium sp.]